MSYLISQIAFSLVMAGIAGAAFGWLLHRARTVSKHEELLQIVSDQDRRLTQTNGEIRMLNDDYEDLKQRSQNEIDVLNQENRQLPQLTQNLEKSQLLVKQLLQKHEGQLREIGSENASLKEQLSTLTDRENLNHRLQSELAALKARKKLVATTADSADAPATEQEAEQKAAQETSQETEQQTANETNPESEQQAAQETTQGTEQEKQLEDEQQTASDSRFVDSTFDEPIDLSPSGSELASACAQDPDASANQTLELESDEIAQSAASVDDVMQDELMTVDESSTDSAIDSLSDATSRQERESSSSWASVKLRSTDDVDELDHVVEIDDELAAQISDVTNLGEDDTLDDIPLFDPVEQHDDLKQIYGIGAVTEKSLNQLGITSYSQLAELERHDIATITEALEIVPGRIERDDWVGGARRQLEDVLEEL